MPEFLGNPDPVDTQDAFTDALTLGPANAKQLTFNNIGPNAIIAQYWKFANTALNNYVLEPTLRWYAPQTYGVTVTGVAGVQFRSATPGKPSQITAELTYETDPLVASTPPSSLPVSGGSAQPIIVNVAVGTPVPFAVADPGAGVSTVPLYTVPDLTNSQIQLVSYAVSWDASSAGGDRAVLYEWLDDTSAHFCWAQSGNVVYTGKSSPSAWLETDIAGMGNYFRTINATVDGGPFVSATGLDFEEGTPFGQVLWPAGFTLQLVVFNMQAADEISGISMLVAEQQAS